MESYNGNKYSSARSDPGGRRRNNVVGTPEKRFVHTYTHEHTHALTLIYRLEESLREMYFAKRKRKNTLLFRSPS